MTGRPMEGFIAVDGQAVTSEAALKVWVDLAVSFVKTLPPKTAKPAKKAPKRMR